jgi:hypothetical protein
MAWHEIAAMVPLVIFMVWIGVHPNTFLKKMEPSVTHLVRTVAGERTNEPVLARQVDESTRQQVAETHPPLGDSTTRRLDRSVGGAR